MIWLVLFGTVVTLWVFSTRKSKWSAKHCSLEDHENRLDPIVTGIRARPPGSKLSLHRRTAQSNTIRNSPHKRSAEYFPVDLGSFDHIIEINEDERYVVCEPGVTIGSLLHELLKHGLTLTVVPELPNITIGGAISGGALESSSFKHGQFFDSVLEIECLTPIVCHASPKINAGLFYAVSASYNTVALLTKVKIRLDRAPAYVNLSVQRVKSFDAAVEQLQQDDRADTLEGLAFAADDIAVIRGRYADAPLYPVKRFARHWDRWYYKTIQTASELSVPYWDYCFRYDYGAFWMAEYVLDMLGGDNIVTRFLIGAFLDTKHLFSVLHASELSDLGRMRVIQDCYVPATEAADFLHSVERQIGTYPLWLCPVRGTSTPQKLACHYAETSGKYINVGIYGRPRQFPFSTEEVNTGLVDLLLRHNARSMLYAQTWHTRDQFEAMYAEGLRTGKAVRQRYGGTGAFFDLYDKVALSGAEREKLRRAMVGTEEQELRKVVKGIFMSKLGL